jgi:hypothetical protein
MDHFLFLTLPGGGYGKVPPPEQVNYEALGLLCKDLPAHPCRETGGRRALLAEATISNVTCSKH